MTGKELRLLRKKLKLSQKDLASLIGISFQTLSCYEKGRWRISTELKNQIKHALGLSLESKAHQLNVHFDYLRVTFFGTTVEIVMKHILKIHKHFFTFSETKINNYNGVYSCGNIRIYTALEQKQGIHLELSGQALSELEELWCFEDISLLDWVKNLFNETEYLSNGWYQRIQCTRVDIAIDELVNDAGNYDLHDLKMRCESEKGLFRTNLKSNKTIEQKFNGISQGLSLYFGTTNGNFLFRAYEKYKETAHREKLDDTSALLKYGIVNRFEMQLRQNYAEKVIEDLLFDNSLYQIAVNLLLSKIEIFEEIVQTNGTSMFNYCRAFYAIFGEYQIVKVNGKERTTAIEKSMRWIEMQVTPTLAVLVRLYGEEWLFNWLKMLIVRIEFSEKQQNLINMEQVLLDKGNQYSNSAYLYSVEAIERFEKKNL